MPSSGAIARLSTAATPHLAARLTGEDDLSICNRSDPATRPSLSCRRPASTKNQDTTGYSRVARPRAQHRSGRGATRSRAMRNQLTKRLSLHRPRQSFEPLEIDRVGRGFLLLRNPAALRDGWATRRGCLLFVQDRDKLSPLTGLGICRQGVFQQSAAGFQENAAAIHRLLAQLPPVFLIFEVPQATQIF